MTFTKFSKILDRHVTKLEREREKEIKVFPKEKEWYDARITQFQKISKLIRQRKVKAAFDEWNTMEVPDADGSVYPNLDPVIIWLETQMADYLLGSAGSKRADAINRANAEMWGPYSCPHVELARKRLNVLTYSEK